MEFLTPLLLGGLAFVSAPIIIHLLHQRRVTPVDWAAMRFLVEMMTRKRRRLLLNELLLLLIRALIITCIALAMVRPAFKRSLRSHAGTAVARTGRTAAVLLVDDSLSSQAGRAQPLFEGMKKLAISYLGTLIPGDEVSVIWMSQLGQPAGDPVFDLETIKSSLVDARPSYVASDIPALIESGLAQLKRHANSGAEIVLITDGVDDGWRFNDVSRWEALRRRLRGPSNASLGSKERPQLLILCPATTEPMRNVAITSIVPDRSVLTVGSESSFKVNLRSRGDPATSSVRMQFLLNGRVLEQRTVEVLPNSEASAVFTHSFQEPGSYAVQAKLLDHHDFLAADDQRSLSIQVEPSLPVLLVDAKGHSGLRGKLGFLRYALDPNGTGGGPFKIAQVPLAQLVPSMLANYRVVVLADASALEPAMVDALDRYVVAGGGVLVGLGPDSDASQINKTWARGGEGFFPAPLSGVSTPTKTLRPAGINRTHPAFAGFGPRTDDAWKAAAVRSFFTLATNARTAKDLEVVLKLENGEPLIVERRRGMGLVALLTTSLNADWNDLPLQPAYVPLMRGLVGRLGSFIMPPRNLLPGEPIVYARLRNSAEVLTGEDPSGKGLPLSLGGWEGREAILSEALTQPGIYLLRDPQIARPIRFAVTPSPDEGTLEPASERQMGEVLDPDTPILRRVEQVSEKLAASGRQSTEIWKWLVAGAILFIFVETWMTRREAAGAFSSVRAF